MVEEAAFIRMILASPDSVPPRLVYADWLDERGDLRGDYLRTLHELDASTLSSSREEELGSKLESLQKEIDPMWAALMNRGRKRKLSGGKTEKLLSLRGRRLFRKIREADVAIFLRQYARKRQNKDGPNDRRYCRDVEARVKRMSAEDFDRLIHGED
jgi:uncharacterized protein (TIGR02996 family)